MTKATFEYAWRKVNGEPYHNDGIHETDDWEEWLDDVASSFDKNNKGFVLYYRFIDKEPVI